MKSNNRLYVRDILGATAILLVVFNHSAAAFVGWKPNLYGIHSFKIAAISHLFVGIQMPIFVMISGYLYQHLISIGKYVNFQKFLKNKIRRLLLPYFILAPLMIISFVPNGASPSIFFRKFLFWCISFVVHFNDFLCIYFFPSSWSLFEGSSNNC